MSPETETPGEAADVPKWIAEAQQGNREALGRLLEMCRRYLLLAANQELTPALRAKVAPSDIVQDTMMEAGRDFPRFHGTNEEELLAWLRGILRHNATNVRRHFETEKRQMAREVPLAEVPQSNMPLEQTESPSRQALAHEQDEQLECAMRRLPEHYRQVLVLHTSEGLTFAQIAEKMDSTAEAVRKQWGRAVEELTKLLETPP